MFRFRVRALLIVVLGGFLMVATRLFYLQILRGDHYREYAENVRLARQATEAARGRIYAAGGELLAYDAPSFNLAVVPSRLPQWRTLCGPVLRLYRLGRREKLLAVRQVEVRVQRQPAGGHGVDFTLRATFLRRRESRLVEREERGSARVVVPAPVEALFGSLAHVAEADVAGMLRHFFKGVALVGRRWRRAGEPCIVARDVGFEAAAEIESHACRYPGARIVASGKRERPYGKLARHVLGYMQCVAAGEYARWKHSYAGSWAKRLLPDDVIGRTGVERSFDPVLRPARGEKLVEVDVARRTQKVLRVVAPVRGCDVYLTLDVALQQAAERALERCGYPGSIVFVEVKTGRVLAMASAPVLDLEADNAEDEAARPDDTLAPRLNRAIQAQYPLGSIFKLLLAIAALQEGTWFRELLCTGRYHGSECHNHRVPMVIDFHNAIKRSCNVYFYRTGQELLGIRRLANWATRFGFGQCTGVRLPGEQPGLLPTPAWLKRARGRRWYSGDTRNLSIGQGYLLVTPMQVVRFVAAVANGGRVLRPRIVDRIVWPSGREQTPEAGEGATLAASPANLARVHRAMRGVCHELGGTGRRAWSGWIMEMAFAVAGKTSTAECWLSGVRSNIGWFVGFAPVHDPRVAFVVALEHRGERVHGGDVAAPVARQVLGALPERYLQGVAGRPQRQAVRAAMARSLGQGEK